MHFENGKVYHLFNRSFEKTTIFISQENFKFFIRKLNQLNGVSDVLAYCLMPDHFHLMIYIPDTPEPVSSIGTDSRKSMQFLSRKIGTILSSYTQAFNKREKRKGSLFQPKTKCKELDESNYAFTCFHYIHQNPLKAKLVSKLEDWEFSSFNEYFKDIQGICEKKRSCEILDIPKNPTLLYNQSYQVINYKFDL